MATQILKVDDIRTLNSPEAIAAVFGRLGYNKVGNPLDINDLELSARNAQAVYDAHLIADQDNGELQVLLLRLQPSEWESSSTASTRMKAIATQIGKRDTEFLLLATTKDYNQLMLVNPRKTFDDKQNVRVSIRKLLIDRTNPTNYDRERLESLAVNGKSPKELYKTHCEEFDVEKLTNSFYKGYKELFERVQVAIKKYNQDPYFDDADRLHQFSQRLLGRIMFLYFLQKKEFLAGDRRFLTTQYDNYWEENDFDYYQTVLEPLFFNTLNKQRPNFDSQWGGKIPYLNGGLFDRDYGPEIRDTAGRETPKTITLPNSLFNPGNTESILHYFNSYNFTVSENVAGDEDIAVDPEMLGKVFENMLAAEERGRSGTFYTPREIVHFMCSEVLARYLADETAMKLEDVQKLIDYDPDVTPEKIKELISPQEAKTLKKAIEEIKVLDPAVGSGAFPLGMMQIILNVLRAVAHREDGQPPKRGTLKISKWKREIIANNLYGVDIKPEAIEIAKLRMWLSLVVDIPSIEDVEPLPNLDYKLMCGDSLISTIHGEQLIPDPNKDKLQLEINVTPIQKAIQPLLELQHKYFDAQSEERHELRKQILEAEANVFRVAVGDRRNFWKGKQAELEQKIKLMAGKVSKAQEKERSEIVAKLAELEKFAQEVESGDRSLNFFQYHLHFRDVFAEKGGFDCVIGNPPYVRADSGEQYLIMRKEIESSGDYETLWEKWDLYVAFIEKGYKLLKRNGLATMIVSDAFCHAKYAQKSQDWFIKNSKIIRLDFLSKLQFFDASVKNIIFLFENEGGANNKPLRLVHSQELGNITALQTDIQRNLTCRAFFPEDNDVLSFENTVKLEDICYISVGMVANAHEKYAKGAFKLKDLLSSVKDEIHPKKFVEGKDIDKWLPSSHKWFEWGTSRSPDLLRRPTFPELYEQNQKIMLTMVGEFRGALDTNRLYCNHGIFVCILWHQLKNVRNTSIKKYARYKDEKKHPDLPSRELLENNSKAFHLKYVLAITNSSLARYFLSVNRRNNIQLYPEDWKQIPIYKATREEQEQITQLVDKILTAKQSSDNANISQLEAEIDQLIYQLYDVTEEEIATIENSS